jgi:hypothetical protein
MITDMNARVAMAQKLSIPQLQQAIKNGTVPAYVGVPLLQDKMRQQQQMAMAQQGQQAQQQPPIAEQIMAEASRGGVDQLPSNLPITDDDEDYANGGIIAFSGENGSTVQDLDAKRRKDSINFDRAYWNSPEGKAEIAQARRMGEPNATMPSKIQEESYTIETGDPKKAFIRTAKNMGISPNGLRYMRNPNLDVLEQMRIEDPKGYESFMGGNTISPEFGGSTITPEQDAERVARIQENDVYAFLRPPPKTATTPTRGSLTEGISPADVARTEAQLPRTGTPSPNAPPSTPSTGIVAPKATTTASEAAPAPMSALDQYAAMLMEERKGIAKDRQQAKAMALLQTGLGIAGGTSPNPLANISQGALQGTQAYQQEMRGIRKEDADRLKQLMSLGIGKEKLALEAKKLGITEKRFDQMYDLETAKLGVMGGQRADSRAQAEELRRLSVAQGLFSTLRKDQLMSGLSDEELWSRAQRMAGQAGTTPVASSGSTVMGSYVPGKGYIPNK